MPVVMVSVVYREGGPEGPAALGEAVVFGEFTVELRLKTSRVEWLRIASGTLTQEAWPSSGPTQSSSETRGLAAHTGSRWSRGLRSRKPIAQRDRQLTQDHPLEDRRNPICAHRLARWLGARRSTSCIRSSDRVLRGWQHLWPPTASHTARRTTSSDPPRRSLCRQPVRR